MIEGSGGRRAVGEDLCGGRGGRRRGQWECFLDDVIWRACTGRDDDARSGGGIGGTV